MKSQLLKTALVSAVSAMLMACGSSPSNKYVANGLADKPESDKEFTGEPASAEEMATQTYRLKTEKQEFVLKKLAHMVWTNFLCKAEIPDGDTTKAVDLYISFYPAFEVKIDSPDFKNSVVSPDSACGRKLANPTGSLTKNDQNQYVLQYGLHDKQNPVLSMTWDANQPSPGELLCTAEDGVVSKALLNECTIMPVTLDKP